jgi:predicted metal-dependent TIM-barrel fold hydrolase
VEDERRRHRRHILVARHLGLDVVLHTPESPDRSVPSSLMGWSDT